MAKEFKEMNFWSDREETLSFFQIFSSTRVIFDDTKILVKKPEPSVAHNNLPSQLTKTEILLKCLLVPYLEDLYHTSPRLMEGLPVTGKLLNVAL